jgi:ELWxxDGT repeat protein
MLGDLRPGPSSSMPAWPPKSFRWANGRVYFASDDGVHGLEPWVSDGTPQGTVLVDDLAPGAADSDPAYFTSAQHGVVFMTDTRTAGGSVSLTGGIWSTTAMGTGGHTGTTTLLAEGEDVVSLDAESLGGVALLATSDFGSNPQLWRSDGTVAGTVQVKQHLTLPDQLSPIGRVALFVDAQNPLWRTDGTPGGTRKVRRWGGNNFGSTFLLDLTVVGRRVFFRVFSDNQVGEELWVSDGTRHGTRVVRDLRPGRASSSPRRLTADGDHLLFIANDGVHDRQLWRADEKGRRTVRLTNLPAARIGAPVHCGNAVYFAATDHRGRELWARSGHPAELRRVVDLVPGPGDSGPRSLTCLGSTLVFTADDGEHGRELWTLAGPRMRPVLHDLSLQGSSRPGVLTEAGSDVYFVASDGVHGREPWILHGSG